MFVRLDHVASFIVNAASCDQLKNFAYSTGVICLNVPEATEWQRIVNQINAATIFTGSGEDMGSDDADGTSVFNVRRGVVPVNFTLTQGGVATCALPPATIALTRTAGGTTGPIDESVHDGPADTDSNFRIDSCHYIYNLSVSALGVGTYRVDIKINGQVVGSATFQLK